MNLICGTTIVSMDEPCKELSEFNLQSPGSKGWRRYQLVYVMRNDMPYECRFDLGPAKSFTTHQFRIPGGVRDELTGRFEILHTVGELMDIADYLRNGYYEAPHYEPAPLLEGYHREMERRRTKKHSTFGAKVAIQRS